MLLKGNKVVGGEAQQMQPMPTQQVKQLMPDGKYWTYYVNNGWGSTLPASSLTYIDEGYAGNSDVYAIIAYTLKAAGGIQWKATKDVRGEQVPLEPTHPVSRMLKYASPIQPFAEFVQNWLGYKLLLGNSYNYYLKPEFGVNAGKPVQMTSLPAHLIEVQINRATGEVTGYRFNNGIILPVEDVSHAKNWNPQVQKEGTLYGLSPLAAGLRLLTMSNNGYDAEGASVANGGVKGILSGKAEDDWSTSETSRIQDSFNRDYMGAENYGKIVVTSAAMQWAQVGVSPADLELMDALRLTKQQLCSLYGFPSQLLNDKEGSLYNTYREAKKVFYTDMLLPELRILETTLQHYLAEPYGSDISVSMDTSNIEVLMDNMVELSQWLGAAWWIKAIDKQRIMRQPEDPEMDKYFIPSGLMTLDELTGMDDDLMKINPIIK
jgi:HK97 family phage portal protein